MNSHFVALIKLFFIILSCLLVFWVLFLSVFLIFAFFDPWYLFFGFSFHSFICFSVSHLLTLGLIEKASDKLWLKLKLDFVICCFVDLFYCHFIHLTFNFSFFLLRLGLVFFVFFHLFFSLSSGCFHFELLQSIDVFVFFHLFCLSTGCSELN